MPCRRSYPGPATPTTAASEGEGYLFSGRDWIGVKSPWMVGGDFSGRSRLRVKFSHCPFLKGYLAIGTTGRGVFYSMGGLLPAPRKAVAAPPAFLLGAGWPVGLDPSGRRPLFPTVGWRLRLAFQLSDACLQCPNVAEQLPNNFNQLFTGGSGQIHGQAHGFSLPHCYVLLFVTLTRV